MFGEKKNRFEDCWNRKNSDRPLIGINVGQFANECYPRFMASLPNGLMQPEQIRNDLILEDLDELWQRHEIVGGDYPFTAAPLYYIPWVEAILGCPIMASPETFWAEPCIESWDGWIGKPIDKNNPWLQKLLDLLQAMVNHSRGRYPLSHTLMRGPTDLMSAMRGAAQLPLDMMLHGDRMKSILDYLADVWIEICQAQLDLIPECADGYMGQGNGLQCWTPNKVSWLQEDATALLSPEIYQRTLLDLDRRILGSFESTAFHLHTSSEWIIDTLVDIPELDVIQYTQDITGINLVSYLKICRKVLAHKPLVIWRAYGDDFPQWLNSIRDGLPVNGLSIMVTVQNVDEGRRIWEWICEATGAEKTAR